VNILRKSNDERRQQFELEHERLVEQLRGVERERDELTKKNQELQTTVQQHNDWQDELQREQDKCRELYRKNVKLESQVSCTDGIEVGRGRGRGRIVSRPVGSLCVARTDRNQSEAEERAQSSDQRVPREQTRGATSESNNGAVRRHARLFIVRPNGQIAGQCATSIENARRVFFAERNQMEKKLEQLVEQLKQHKAKISSLQRQRDEQRTRYDTLSTQLNDKSRLVEAKLNQIQEKELSLQSVVVERRRSIQRTCSSFSSRNVVSLQTHNRLKRQLSRLLRKHVEFQDILGNNQQQTNATTSKSDVGRRRVLGVTVRCSPFVYVQEPTELRAVLTRVDQLSHEQEEQWNELQPGIVPSTQRLTRIDRSVSCSSEGLVRQEFVSGTFDIVVDTAANGERVRAQTRRHTRIETMANGDSSPRTASVAARPALPTDHFVSGDRRARCCSILFLNKTCRTRAQVLSVREGRRRLATSARLLAVRSLVRRHVFADDARH
jgi:hypothetical protein